jgi:hypothetical protein
LGRAFRQQHGVSPQKVRLSIASRGSEIAGMIVNHQNKEPIRCGKAVQEKFRNNSPLQWCLAKPLHGHK